MHRFLLRQRYSTTIAAAAHSSSSLVQRRGVHDLPFSTSAATSPEEASHTALATARDALLQFNIMISRGVEPDVFTYTSMIATMANAKLEWQAYKLFSRMIEQGVTPMPETYVALKDATSPKRKRLVADLEKKILESVDTFAEDVAKDEAARSDDTNRRIAERFQEYLASSDAVIQVHAAKLSQPTPESSPAQGTAPSEGTKEEEKRSSSRRDGDEAATSSQGDPYTAVHIKGPNDVWATHVALQQERQSHNRLRDAVAEEGTERDALFARLNKLHDQELRVFLTVHRQLRHGSRQELLERVVGSIGCKHITEMLSRRDKYFRSVEGLLQMDLDALQGGGGGGEDKRTEVRAQEEDVEKEEGRTTASEDAKEEDMKRNSRPMLLTPWGVLRNPTVSKNVNDSVSPVERSAALRASRVHHAPLSAEESDLIFRKARLQELDELPESLLRRYASQHNLPWKRHHANSLRDVVNFHVQAFSAGNPAASPSLRDASYVTDMNRTLENYEVFRVISQRTHNLQVVDDKELNSHLNRVRARERKAEQRVQDELRRERHIRDAEALRLQARTVDPVLDPLPSSSTPPQGDRRPVERGSGGGRGGILGLEQGDVRATRGGSQAPPPPPLRNGNAEHDRSSSSSTALPAQSDELRGELPPWALESDSGVAYNFQSKRFGEDRLMGTMQELSDGRFRVLPRRDAQEQYEVDVNALPQPLQDVVRRSTEAQRAQAAEAEQRHQENLKHPRYRRFMKFITSAKAKRRQAEAAAAKSEGGRHVKPVGPRRRMSYLLRSKQQQQKLSEDVVAEFMKPL